MTTAQEQATDWVAVDWGTTHVRLWCLAADGTILTRRTSDQGMGQITAEAYESVLLQLLADHLPADAALGVVVCGLAGSRQGWIEAPYVATPCDPRAGVVAISAPVSDPRLNVHILPGVKQQDPADVMRGEETQIRGVIAQEPGFDGVICLPGTHTKWVRVQAGQIVEFATIMSGELFEVIGQHSVLRHSVGGTGWDAAAFENSCRKAAQDPALLIGSLFGLRAQSLLADLGPAAARASLSGLLLGAELGAMRRLWDAKPVTIVGENTLAQAYAAALALHGQVAKVADAETTTLNGLRDAYAQLQETDTHGS